MVRKRGRMKKYYVQIVLWKQAFEVEAKSKKGAIKKTLEDIIKNLSADDFDTFAMKYEEYLAEEEREKC